ncbi:MAG: DUF389 domain-containing protein [Actinomycetota bacterium]|nr:DUF389 domain-containing protein [Actinomycetota bacterium]
MVHLRIIAPSGHCSHVLELLEDTETVFNVIYLKGVATKPDGDLIECDVASRDVSLLVADLRELDIDRDGSIAIDEIDSEISGIASGAKRRKRDDIGADPVIWENVASRTSENVELSHSFLIFMVLAMLIASVGIYFDQPILIVGAMVVGPDFGPIAGICVALVNRDHDLIRRSATALLVGFGLGMIATFVATLLLDAVDQIPETIDFENHDFTAFISNPDFFSVYVSLVAGVVGTLSLTTAKSSVLVGVLISVTTIPAAANVGVAAAYADWSTAGGAALQLVLNLFFIFVAGLITLTIQRRIYMARRREHLSEESRRDAGLPLGRSRRAEVDPHEEPEAT